MKRLSRDVLESTNISRSKLIVIVASWTIALMAVSHFSGIDKHVQQKFMAPINFYIRSTFGPEQHIDPRIKIFSIDDSTITALDRAYLDLEEWSRVFRAFDRQRPKMILVDKAFGIGDSKYPVSEKEFSKFFSHLATPLYVGSFISPKEIAGRSLLDLKQTTYSSTQYLRVSSRSSARPKIPPQRGFVYGPIPNLREYFSGIGHLHYAADHMIAPFFNLGGRKLMPFLGTYAASSAEYRDGMLYFDDHLVPTTSSGHIPLNFLPTAKISASNKSLLPVLKGTSTSLRKVTAADIVVILPLMYTGNTDFKDTPFGPQPAGHVLVSFVNSVLQKNWIKSVDQTPVVIIISALVASVVGYYSSSVWLTLISLLVVATSFVGSMLLFSWFGIAVPWAYGIGSYLGVSLSLMISRSRMAHARANILRFALDGAIAPSEMQTLVKKKRVINLEAREHVVTVMFIDVVGYSLLSENQIPRVAFEQLKTLLGQLSDEIHSFDGMVNKTLGDGLLCIFGYDFETESVSTDHAEKAVAAAISIQEKNLKLNLKAAKLGEPVYPLRVGIHTASVFLGDLGAGDRIDFTAVGNGVNFAKRMEQACEIHSILFSATTRDLIGSLGLNARGLSKKMISIKHHTTQIEAFEYDPFFAYPDVRSLAIDAYRQCASLARSEQRFSVVYPDAYVIKASVGHVKIINFSTTGMSLKLKSHMVKGSTINLTIDSVDGKLGKSLKLAGVGEIVAEVRWAYTEVDGSVHGLYFRNIDESLALKMVEVIRAFDISLKLIRTSSKLAGGL